MKRLITLVGFLILAMNVVAQGTDPRLQLADSIKQVAPELVDLDNDGLLDILLLMKNGSNNSYVGLVKGDTVNPLSQIEKTFPVASPEASLVADYNRDNAMDIIISGEKNGIPVTVVYLNKGGFNFEEQSTTIPSFTTARFADLDNDAMPEMIISGEDNDGYYFKILKQLSNDAWNVVHDSLKMKCSAMETVDADGDGDLDLFVSGISNLDLQISGFLMNEGDFYFKQVHTLELTGKTSIGDLNGDGFFEIILMAVDANNQWHTKKYERIADDYHIENMSTVLQNGNPFIADFNYDGIADVNFQGLNSSGDPVNIIQYSNGENLLLPTSPVVTHRFGDIEHDGDLDLLTIADDGVLSITFPQILEEAKNLAPGNPLHAVALPVFNRIFMYWGKPADDRTPQGSLTYDVHLNGDLNYQAGEFDVLNEKRLTVTHGNNGTQNFKLLKKVTPLGLMFMIQSVDNSYHAGSLCLGGVGVGASVCATVATEEIIACTNENIVFEAPGNALWFSFADGFLGKGNDLEFTSYSGDTLFYYNPMGEGCSSLKAWTIKINNDTLKIEKGEKYACLNASIEFKVESGWESAGWSSMKKGSLGDGSAITFNVTEPDSVFVNMTNAAGCQILRRIAVKISQPELHLSADQYKIMKGGDVQLEASGSQRYTWAPSTGLSQSDIPNPIASPAVSTQYLVTGYDSLGCHVQATVSITVEEMGFIPNLFSPNADGQNDELKIYGLVSVQRFSFTIYDREGALVYKTSDVLEAVQRGWDGTKNGTKQPPGVYFWKVEGELPSGRLRLNGKDSGSIVLIR